jgi:hypothetical protein
MTEFVTCAGVLGFFTLLYLFILAMRYMNYRETMALAEKGLVRPEPQRSNGKGMLVWGVIIAAMGAALCIGLLPIGLSGLGGGNYIFGLGPWMLLGLLPFFFGMALVLVYLLTRESKKEVVEKPGFGPLKPALEPEPPAAEKPTE